MASCRFCEDMLGTAAAARAAAAAAALVLSCEKGLCSGLMGTAEAEPGLLLLPWLGVAALPAPAPLPPAAAAAAPLPAPLAAAACACAAATRCAPTALKEGPLLVWGMA